MYRNTLALLVAAGLVAAQRPDNTSICDYYTTALFKNNTGANQYALVSAVVNRAGLGNQTTTPAVDGIITPGMYNGVAVSLGQYFTGALNSTNRGGDSGVSVNFLDGGGAAPILEGKPANDTSSNQYKLFTHLYEYFGALLGCSAYGKTGYAAYDGNDSQYEVHKFMGLDENEVGYFNTQVGLSAASFGVTQDDVTIVANALNSVFNVKCAPAQTVATNQMTPELQSICIAESCPLSPNATCSSYPAVPAPANVTTNGTSPNPSSSASASKSGSATGSKTTGQGTSTGSAAHVAVGGILGAAALVLAL